MSEVLSFGPDGWRRDGQLWRPERPLYGVLGDPIEHSLSPYMQTAALRERDLDADYMAIHIAAGDLRRLKNAGADTGLAGFNVTAPHKEAVSRLCDGRTDQARALGAVNTVKIEDGRWLGHNTDSGGVLAVLTQAWPDDAPPPRAVVLGAGGSARAAVDALLRWPVAAVEVRNRSERGREAFARWVSGRDDGDRVSVTVLEAGAGDAPAVAEVWICCLAGGVAIRDFLPVAAGPGSAVLMDLRYGDQRPAEPAPVGFGFSDGLPLLLMQGGLAFSWWFGPPVPWSEMRQALPSHPS